MKIKKIKALFICTGNSCRSQIAEGLLRFKAGEYFEVYSAGSHPSHVHPMAIEIMKEKGIDISNHTSDHINNYLDFGIDVVITVCDSANRLCPTFPVNVKKVHWSIEDPFRGWTYETSQLDSFRKTMEEIEKRIIIFIKNCLDN